MRTLIIEDDNDTSLFLKKCLKEKGHTVDIATDGEQGSSLARTNDYDLVLLDCGLPKKSGMTVCSEIRTQEHEKRKHVPIIMISATGESANKINGLDTGADDYITKPFLFDEVFSRIQAVLRRPQQIEQSTVFTVGDLTLDNQRQEVTRGKESIYLTRKEFALLEFLVKNQGKVVSRSSLIENLWDMATDPFSNTIETHILNLRKKIDKKHAHKLIHSIHGRGYKIDTHR